MNPGPTSKAGCLGCNRIFSLADGQEHILSSWSRDNPCRRWGRLDLYTVQEGAFTYKRLADKTRKVFASNGLPIYRCEASYIYTILDGGTWRRKHKIDWGFDWAIEMADMIGSEFDQGEAAKAIKLCRKDAQLRKAVQSVMFLSVQDDEKGTLLNYDRQQFAKHAAMKRFLECYKNGQKP